MRKLRTILAVPSSFTILVLCVLCLPGICIGSTLLSSSGCFCITSTTTTSSSSSSSKTPSPLPLIWSLSPSSPLTAASSTVTRLFGIQKEVSAEAASEAAQAAVSKDVEKEMVRQQLGYVPSNYVCVSARCAHGTPLAIQTYPLQGGAPKRQAKAKVGLLRRERQNSLPSGSTITTTDLFSTTPTTLGAPFPTLFWLTHPDVSRAIAGLEGLGYLNQIEDWITADPVLQQEMWQSHKDYAQQRWNTLSRSHQIALTTDTDSTASSVRRMRNILQCSGIAGTNLTLSTTTPMTMMAAAEEEEGTAAVPTATIMSASIPSLKCLHTHYAHFVSTTQAAAASTAAPVMLSPSSGKKQESCRNNQPTTNPVGAFVHKLLLEQYPYLRL